MNNVLAGVKLRRVELEHFVARDILVALNRGSIIEVERYTLITCAA